MLASLTAKAQDRPADYFVGAWDVVIIGAPDGDMESRITLERREGKLTGYMSGFGEEKVAFTQVDEGNDESVTLSFSFNGMDIQMLLKKQDENTVKGDVMGMLDVSGKRIVGEQ